MTTVLLSQLLELCNATGGTDISQHKLNHPRYIARPMLALSEFALRTTVYAARASPYFSLITDLSSDIANHENMILFIRYWDHESMSAVTSYLCCVHLMKKDGAAVFDAVKKVCNALSLDLVQKLICLCADGDGAMQGHNIGLLAQLRSFCDHVLAIHCAAHRHVLAVQDSAKDNSLLKLVDQLITSVYSLFNRKAKRYAMWELYCQKHGVTAKKFQLFNDTRWWSRAVCVQQLVSCLPVLVSFLYICTLPDSEVYWPAAKSVLHELKRPLVLVALHFTADLISVLESSRKVMEGTEYSIMLLKDHIDASKRDLQEFSDELSACVNLSQMKGKYMKQLCTATNGFQPGVNGQVVASWESPKHKFSAVLTQETLPSDIMASLAAFPLSAIQCLQDRFPSSECELTSLLGVIDYKRYIGKSQKAMNSSAEGMSLPEPPEACLNMASTLC